MSLLVMIMGIGTAFAAARAVLERSDIQVVDQADGSRADVGVIALDDPELLLEAIDRYDELEAAARPPRCVVMAPMTSGELLVTAIAAGADGWVLPDIPPAALVRTIEGIHAGESGFSRTDTVHLVAALRDRGHAPAAAAASGPPVAEPSDGPDLLTARERQIHAAYRAGGTPVQIAQHLQVSRSTVRWHLARINKKLAAGGEEPTAPLRASRVTPAIAFARPGSTVPPAAPGRPFESPLATLGRAELRVALLVAEGLSNKEVAEQLFISRHTVESHLKSIFAKTHVRSRVELTRLALRGVSQQITPPDDGRPVESQPA